MSRKPIHTVDSIAIYFNAPECSYTISLSSDYSASPLTEIHFHFESDCSSQHNSVLASPD